MAPKKTYDLIVIGAGPGGYVASVRAAQLGLHVACIEKRPRLGGVCLNVGCIPSKALLDSSEYYHLAQHHLAEHGIRTGKVRLNLEDMMARKDRVVEALTDNVRKLLEGNHVDIIHGAARLAGPDRVEVRAADDPKSEVRTLDAKAILLATGSEPVSVPGLEFDGRRIVGSTEALRFTSVPKHLGIVGGGYIGLELGSVWARLGSKVTVIEMLPGIGTGLDGQAARTLQRLLKQQGMAFRLNSKVVAAETKESGITVELEGEEGSGTITCDRLLVAVGRKPLLGDLGLDDLGIETDADSGRIRVNAAYQTTVSSVYAVGDIVPGPMLAHKASAEGIAAVENLTGMPSEVNYDAVPAVIYTWPEVASVGLTEEQVKERGIPYCVGTFPFSGTGRARCMGETEGFVKLISHSKTDRVLGVHIIGARAADMIAESVLAVEFGAASEDIARTIHGHPTFAEALQEAAMAARSCAIYSS